MKHILPVLGLLSLFLLIPVRLVFADSPTFTTDIEVLYAVDTSGETTVTYEVTVTNAQSLSYPEEYHLLVESNDVKNAVAFDPKGFITPSVIQAGPLTDIGIRFHQVVTGLGNKLAFTVRYQTNDIAHRDGKIWKVSIPKILNTPDITSYVARLDVPTEFGPIAYMYPQPHDNRRWVKDQLIDSGIYAEFGTHQNYHILLRYDISNPNAVPDVQSIVLPPETAYQTVTIDTIIPLPSFVSRDEYGQWVGKYKLNPHQNLDVKASLLISVYTHPRVSWIQNTHFVNPNEPKYAETDDPQKNTVRPYETPEKILSFVMQTEGSSSGKLGSYRPDRVLRDSKDIYTPQNAAFIRLSRTAGIPARLVGGVAIVVFPEREPVLNQKSGFHTWSEYYNSDFDLWMPVDPVWAGANPNNTYLGRLDFRHIALFIDGSENIETNHILPLPLKNLNTDSISVEVLDADPSLNKGRLTGTLKFPALLISGTTGYGTISLENLTGIPVESVSAVIQSSRPPFTFSTNQNDLTPYSVRNIIFRFPFSDFFAFGKGELRLTMNNETSSYPFFALPLLPILVVSFILIGLFALILRFVYSARTLWIFRKKN